MNNYSVIFSILGYYFKIITHDERLLKEQVKHIKKFCITNPVANINISNCTTLEYIENADMFANVRKNFDVYPTETIKSFEGIFHLKFEHNQKEYFCQIDDEWILIKNNDVSYIVLGNGINKTTKYLFRVIREIYESNRVEWAYFRKTPFERLCKNADRLTTEISKKVKIIWVEFGRNVDINQFLEQL